MRRMVSDKDIALLEDLENNNVNSNTISQIYIVDNIKAISGDILTKLKAGDIVLKNTNGQLHAYNVSFKKDGTGICLTYTDASVVETQSYDYKNSAWVYNSEDKTNLVNYSAGDNVNITNGVISATDTKYTAGTNITISDGVISAAAGDVWENVVVIKFGNGYVRVRLFTKEELTTTNYKDIVAAELANKWIDCFPYDSLPEISSNLVLPLSIKGNGGTGSMSITIEYLNLSSSTLSTGTTSYTSSYVDYSHKIN